MSEPSAMSGASSEGGGDSPQDYGRSVAAASSAGSVSAGSAYSAFSSFEGGMPDEAKEDIYQLLMRKEIRTGRSLRDIRRSANRIHQCTGAEATLLLVRLAQDAIFEFEEDEMRDRARDGLNEAAIENLREIQQLRISLQGAQENARREEAARIAAQADFEKLLVDCREIQDRYTEALDANEKYVSESAEQEQRLIAMQDEISAMKLEREVAADLARSLGDLHGEMNAIGLEMEVVAESVSAAPEGHAEAESSAKESMKFEQIIAELTRAKLAAEEKVILCQKEVRSLKAEHEAMISKVKEAAKDLGGAGTSGEASSAAAEIEKLKEEIAMLQADVIVKKTEVEAYRMRSAQADIKEPGNMAKASSRSQQEDGDGMSTASKWDAEEAKARERASLSKDEMIRNMARIMAPSLNPADRRRSHRNYEALNALQGEQDAEAEKRLPLIEIKDSEFETLLTQVRKTADAKTGKHYVFKTEEQMLDHVEKILREATPSRETLIGAMNSASIVDAIFALKARYDLVQDNITGTPAEAKYAFKARLARMQKQEQQILLAVAETAFSKVSSIYAERCAQRPRSAADGASVLSELRGANDAGWHFLVAAAENVIKTKWQHMLEAFKDLIKYMECMEEACHGSIVLIGQEWEKQLSRFERNYGTIDMQMIRYFGKLTVVDSPKTKYIQADKVRLVEDREYDDGFSDYESAAAQLEEVWEKLGERELTASDLTQRHASLTAPKNWRQVAKQHASADKDKVKATGVKVDYVKVAREVGVREAYSALFVPEIPKSTGKACQKCGAFHPVNADCGPSLETKLKQTDEIDKIASNVSRMAKIFAKSKRSAEDDKLLEGFVTKLNEIAAKLRAPTSRTHENARRTAKADCHHWIRGECRFQDCRFAHDPSKKGSRKSDAGDAQEAKGAGEKDAPVCKLEGCDKKCPWQERWGKYWKYCTPEHAQQAKEQHAACPAISVDDPGMSNDEVLEGTKYYHTRADRERDDIHVDEEFVIKATSMIQKLSSDLEMDQVDCDDPEDMEYVGKVLLIAAFEDVIGNSLGVLDRESVEQHWEPGMISAQFVQGIYENPRAHEVARLYNAALMQIRQQVEHDADEAANQAEIARIIQRDEIENEVRQVLDTLIGSVLNSDEEYARAAMPEKRTGVGPNQRAWEEWKEARRKKQEAALAHQAMMRRHAEARAQKERARAEKKAAIEAIRVKDRECRTEGLVLYATEGEMAVKEIMLDIVQNAMQAIAPKEAKVDMFLQYFFSEKTWRLRTQSDERREEEERYNGPRNYNGPRKGEKPVDRYRATRQRLGRTWAKRQMRDAAMRPSLWPTGEYGYMHRRYRRTLHMHANMRMKHAVTKHAVTRFLTAKLDPSGTSHPHPSTGDDRTESDEGERNSWRDIEPADLRRQRKRRKISEVAQWERTGVVSKLACKTRQNPFTKVVLMAEDEDTSDIHEEAFAPHVTSAFMSLGTLVSRHLHYDDELQEYIAMPASDAIDFFASYNMQISEVKPGLILILYDTGCTVLISPLKDHFCVEIECNAAINGIGQRDVKTCGPVAISFLDIHARGYVTFESPRGFLMPELNFGIFPSGLAERLGWEFHVRELNPYFVADGARVPLIKDYQTGLTWMAERKQAKPTVEAKRRFVQKFRSDSQARVFDERVGEPEICPRVPDTKESIDNYISSTGVASYGQYHTTARPHVLRGGSKLTKDKANAMVSTRSQNAKGVRTDTSKKITNPKITDSQHEEQGAKADKASAKVDDGAVEEESEEDEQDQEFITESGFRDAEMQITRSSAKSDEEMIEKAKAVAASKAKPRCVKVPAARFFEVGESEQVAAWHRFYHQLAVHLESATVWEGVKRSDGAEVFKGLKMLEMVNGTHRPTCACHQCLQYKSALSPIPGGRTDRPRLTERVGKLYLDPSGKLSTPSVFHNFQYYVLGVTDKGYMIVGGMTFRDQVLFVIGRIFDSIGGAPHVVQVDPAGELNSKVAQSYFTHREAHRDVTQSGEHWRNGKPENRHRLVKGCTRCTLAHANAPLEFWYLCLSHVVFTLNLLLLARGNGMQEAGQVTVWEAHFGERPNLNRYLVGPWGCLAYIVLTKEQRAKKGFDKSWGPRALAGIYVGCVMNHKEGAYEFLVHDGMRIRSTTANLRIVGDCFPFKYQQKRDINLIVEPQEEEPEDEEDDLIANVGTVAEGQNQSALSCAGMEQLLSDAACEQEQELQRIFVFVGKESTEAGERLKKRVEKGRSKSRALLKPKRKVHESIARNPVGEVRDARDYLVEIPETGEKSEMLDPRDFKLPSAPAEFDFKLPYSGARYKIAEPSDFSSGKEMEVTMKNPHERFVGRRVRKVFRIRRKVRGKAVTVSQPFEGKVRSYEAKRGVFDILYEDKDEEEVDFLELGDILIMDPEFGDKTEHKGMTRVEVTEKMGEEALIAAVAEEAMGSHGRTSYGEDRPRRKVKFAEGTNDDSASGGQRRRSSLKKRIEEEQKFSKWMYDESEDAICGCTPGEPGEKEMGYVHSASKCECKTCCYCYACVGDEVKWCDEKFQALMCGDDDITFGKGEFSCTKTQLEQRVRQAKIAREKRHEREAYTAAAAGEGGQGIEDSTSSPAAEGAEQKVDDAPKNAKELHAHPEYEDIVKSGKLEIKQLFDMGVFVEPSAEELRKIGEEAKRVLRCKMVYARKFESIQGSDGQIRDRFLKWKGRLAAIGTGEVKSLDTCWSTFSPTIGMTAMRTLIALMCREGFDVRSYDLSGAFLGTDLAREVYVKLPEEAGRYAGKIVRCVKALYGLITSSRDFVHSLSERILSFEYNGAKFRKLDTDHCIYVFQDGSGNEVILSHYVDDIICGANNPEVRSALFKHLNEQWKITDEGVLTRFVGLNFERSENGLTWEASCGPYIDKIAKRFNVDFKPQETPMDAGFAMMPEDLREEHTAEELAAMETEFRSMIGSLAFASVTVRWDIAYSVSVLSRYLMKPNRKVISAARRVIQYLMTTRDFKIRWTTEKDQMSVDRRNKLWGAADASYASDAITRRSHGGYMLFLNGGCVSWKSGLQKMVTLSSCESEFVALCSAILEVRYLRQFLNELGHRQAEPTLLWEDNKAAIIVAEGETSSAGRTKHVDVRFKHVAQSIREGVARVRYISTKWNYADLMTKPLPKLEFKRLRDLCLRPESGVADYFDGTEEAIPLQEELANFFFDEEW